jgi:hypothetical protein
MLNYKKDINYSFDALNRLPPKKRLDFIIDHETPTLLVRSMKTTDLLLTIHEVGAESSLELFEMLSPFQVQEILDLEAWPNDVIDLGTIGHYLSLMLAANQESAFAQIYGLDIELIGLMFKLIARIYDVTQQEEPDDFADLYSVSPDGRFIVCFEKNEKFKTLALSLHTFLEQLYGRDIKFALRLLENVRFELTSGLMEESIRWRKNRLLDLGILPPEERVEFFAPLSQTEIKKILFNKPLAISSPITHSALPTLFMGKSIENRFIFLHTALANCESAHQEVFFNDLMHVFINMHASLSGNFGAREELAKVSEYIKFLADMGLAQLCKGDINKAAVVITQWPAKYFIRLGRSVLLGLQKRLRAKVSQRVFFGPNFQALDSPLREVAKALNLREPQYYEGLLEPQKLGIRLFYSLHEISATINAVDELIFRAYLVSCLGFNDQILTKYPQLSHSNMYARSMINSYFGNKDYLVALPYESMRKIFDEEHRLKNEFKLFAKTFTKNIIKNFISDFTLEEIINRADKFLITLFIQLEQNWQLLIG